MEELLIVLVILGFLFVLSELSSTKYKLKLIESKLNVLLEKNGISANGSEFVPIEVQYALKNGKKIRAIRLYREHTGASLIEAQKAINDYLANT
ncbi:hypothetical protein [Parashewanella tropica]|uniref:hypothetical protein n=1 Tax=Parashewanella tropica TaxID=2547970 RepID=UPI0010594840|nr:hypothetical protein [Parashewanella tropica]